MRMFRSVRNAVTKVGRTSNITGSRIRSSARTLRESSVNLIQRARAKAAATSPVQGYRAATANRNQAGSAAKAGENARKRAYNAGSTIRQQRGAAYQAIKSAPSPQSGLGYRAGYRLGAQVAASKYKSNIATKIGSPQPQPHTQKTAPRMVATGRTGLESRTLTQATAALIQAKRAALSAGRTVSSMGKYGGPSHIQSPVSSRPIGVAASAKMGKNMVRGVIAGARAGMKMPHATISQAYNAQRWSGGSPNVTLKSRGVAGAFAGGYGVGKAINKTISAAKAAKGLPGRIVGGIRNAAANNRLTQGIAGGLQAAKTGTSRLDRIASRITSPVERGLEFAANAGAAAVMGGVKVARYGAIKTGLASAPKQIYATGGSHSYGTRSSSFAGFNFPGQSNRAQGGKYSNPAAQAALHSTMAEIKAQRNRKAAAASVSNAYDFAPYQAPQKPANPVTTAMPGKLTPMGRNSVVANTLYQHIRNMRAGVSPNYSSQPQPQAQAAPKPSTNMIARLGNYNLQSASPQPTPQSQTSSVVTKIRANKEKAPGRDQQALTLVAGRRAAKGFASGELDPTMPIAKGATKSADAYNAAVDRIRQKGVNRRSAELKDAVDTVKYAKRQMKNSMTPEGASDLNKQSAAAVAKLARSKRYGQKYGNSQFSVSKRAKGRNQGQLPLGE